MFQFRDRVMQASDIYVGKFDVQAESASIGFVLKAKIHVPTYVSALAVERNLLVFAGSESKSIYVQPLSADDSDDA